MIPMLPWIWFAAVAFALGLSGLLALRRHQDEAALRGRIAALATEAQGTFVLGGEPCRP